MENDNSLKSQVDEVVSMQLGGASRKVCKSKSIHDSVWGTIVLEAHEIALIDTPLWQRLRRIRQLGSSHLVFPGAVHTRFEHTLGVAHLVDRMCDGLCVNKKDAVNDDQRQNLRVAALCHDLGHGPFSHYSEMFFKRMLDKDGDFEDSGAAEQLSAMVVRSDEMRKLLGSLNETYGTSLDADFVADTICGALSPEQAYLGEIVHGSFDADKLDYLTRDGKYCGIPINLDPERIFTSMFVTEVEGRSRLAGHKKAAATLSQLVHHKHYMHTVVYQHEVSRAFKAMCINAFESAQEQGSRICGRELASPADFLLLDDEMILTPGSVDDGVAARLFADIRERRLFKVAKGYGKDELSEDAAKRITSSPDEVRREIANTAKVRIEDVHVDPVYHIDNSEARKLLVMDDKNRLTLGELMSSDDQGSSIYNFLVRHLVFAPAQCCDAVSEATAKVLG